MRFCGRTSLAQAFASVRGVALAAHLAGTRCCAHLVNLPLPLWVKQRRINKCDSNRNPECRRVTTTRFRFSSLLLASAGGFVVSGCRGQPSTRKIWGGGGGGGGG